MTGFATRQCPTRSVGAAKLLLTGLRSFLRFAHLEGVTSLPLAQAVPSTAGWSGAGMPKALWPGQAAALLAGCEPEPGDRPARLRDPGTAGPARPAGRGSLRPDPGRCGLAGRGDRGPRQRQPHRAATATGRCRRGDRGLLAPGPAGQPGAGGVPARPRTQTGPDTGGSLRGRTRRRGTGRPARCRRAPVAPHRRDQLLRAGATLAEVAQILRHKDAATSALYAKVDQDALRPLALPWPVSAR